MGKINSEDVRCPRSPTHTHLQFLPRDSTEICLKFLCLDCSKDDKMIITINCPDSQSQPLDFYEFQKLYKKCMNHEFAPKQNEEDAKNEIIMRYRNNESKHVNRGSNFN